MQKQPLPQIELKQLKLNPPKLKCIAQELAIFICASPQCQNYAFVCSEQNCKCHLLHESCLLIQPNRLTNKIQKKMVDSQGISQQINRIVDKCIDWLSEWREKMELDMKYYGLTQIEKHYIQSIHDKNFDQISGKTVFPILQGVNKQNQVMKVEEAVQLMAGYWEKQMNSFQMMFQGLQSLVLNGQNFTSSNQLDSKIIKSNDQVKTLKSFFNKKIKKFKLLYRASQNDFQVKSFYERCSKISNTIVLVQTAYEKKIGGYTPLQWKIRGNEQNTPDPTLSSFIFSITNQDKFTLIQPSKAIQYYGQGCGPRFGGTSGASDLTIKDRAHENNESYALFNNCYHNEKYKKSDTQSYRKFTGGDTNFFKVKQWEVHQVQFA